MTEKQMLSFWGKTCRQSDNPHDYITHYHPLFFHLIDVGHAALALWDEVLPEITKQRIANALKCSVDSARLVVAFLTASHDLGKASPGFQFQQTSLDWIKERIEDLGLSIPVKAKNEPHNFISTKELRIFWQKEQIGFWHADAPSEKVLAHITGAHHGTFPISLDYTGWKDDVVGDATWQQARLEIMITLKDAFCPPDWEFPPTLKWDDLGAVPLLAGFISVADWIGSSKHFPLMGHRDGTNMPTIAQYLPLSKQRALEALAEFGWTRTPSPVVPRPEFASFWGFTPNALQEVIATQTAKVDAPFLLIAEAPMGIGKTEGALWATDAALSAQVNSGFYVALPTQATSNAMHTRVQEFLKKRLFDAKDLHLQLVHGNAALSDDVKVVFNGLNDLYDDNNQPGEEARIVAMSWFCGAKRPLLAPFGVGTIDQSLMATLQTRHWFVRLFGLAGKVVVFDEVHAYDTYMSELLNTLLGWLKELGCSVVLLSATLPKNKRAELLEAWGVERAPVEADYPRVTWSVGDQKTASSLSICPKELAQKTVVVERLHPDNLNDELRKKLANGGCAVVICNTVAEAQDLFSRLKTDLGDFVETDNWILFHARMPFGWRQRIEKKILRKFGKKKANRPTRAIVVATQVIEQSLDLDFDWMASFMSPTDLLLQRIGRLHRHQLNEKKRKIKRPKGLEIPIFALLCEIPPDHLEPPSFGNSEWVYEREILLRSWLHWQNKKQLELPGEIEPLIEATYTAKPEAPNEAWQKALVDAQAVAEKERTASQRTAEGVVIKAKTQSGNLKRPVRFVEEGSHNLRDPDDPEVHRSMKASTREGLPSITAICLCKHENRFYLPNEEGKPDLTEEVNLDAEPNRQMVRKLMDFAVPLSRPQIYHPLSAESVLKGWRKIPLLRHTRIIAFEQGSTIVGETPLRLDGELGLVIEKAKTKEKKIGAE